jgi:hypothetical protein
LEQGQGQGIVIMQDVYLCKAEKTVFWRCTKKGLRSHEQQPLGEKKEHFYTGNDSKIGLCP